MKKYITYSRYEYYSMSGKTWTDWFAYFGPKTDTPNDDELVKYYKNCIATSKVYDKITKLKTEYKIDEYDYIPLKEQLENERKAKEEKKLARKKKKTEK